MENTEKRRIELHIDPDAKTARIIADNVSLWELIDCYVHAAAAVADTVARNSDEVTAQEAIYDILIQFLQTYSDGCDDDDDEEGADNGND